MMSVTPTRECQHTPNAHLRPKAHGPAVVWDLVGVHRQQFLAQFVVIKRVTEIVEIIL